jgi:annexin A7/11
MIHFVIFKAGEKKLGTDEAEFVRVFSNRSHSELFSIFALYEEKYKRDMETVIRKEFSGNLCAALLTIGKD